MSQPRCTLNTPVCVYAYTYTLVQAEEFLLPLCPTQVAHLPERAVFYTSVLPLLAYYGLFATVIYPIAGSLHPMDLMNSLMGSVPVGECVGGWVAKTSGVSQVSFRAVRQQNGSSNPSFQFLIARTPCLFAVLFCAGLHGLLKVIGNWTYSLFFCMAEVRAVNMRHPVCPSYTRACSAGVGATEAAMHDCWSGTQLACPVMALTRKLALALTC